MDNKYLEDPIRTLARSYSWQAIYHRCKDLPGQIELFENKKDFSHIQLTFLYYIEQIAGLYYDIAIREKLIIEEVINDEIRTNAYLFYKNKHKEDKQINNINSNQSSDKLICIPRKKAK